MPVLSEQIADVEPRVSTDRSRFTIAPLAASACVPSERTVVTTAGSPVGMAATARLIPTRKSSSKSSPRMSPRTTTSASAMPAKVVSRRVSWSSWRVSGVFSCWTWLSIPEIWPTWVAMPVSVTTISPLPRVTVEFM